MFIYILTIPKPVKIILNNFVVNILVSLFNILKDEKSP